MGHGYRTNFGSHESATRRQRWSNTTDPGAEHRASHRCQHAERGYGSLRGAARQGEGAGSGEEMVRLNDGASRRSRAHHDETEQGKTLKWGKPGERLSRALSREWFGEQAKRIDGDVIPVPSPDNVYQQSLWVLWRRSRHEFPQRHDCRYMAPPLVQYRHQTGIETPLSALAMAELAARAGVPAGVLNVVVGASSEIGPALTDSPIVRKLTFTGSTKWAAG